MSSHDLSMLVIPKRHHAEHLCQCWATDQDMTTRRSIGGHKPALTAPAYRITSLEAMQSHASTVAANKAIPAICESRSANADHGCPCFASLL